MFGYFRFLLAAAVVISHLGYNCSGVYPGPAAVVSFYMLAGYVVTHLLTNVFQRGPTLIARFYFERILRIFPLYLYIFLLTLIFVYTTNSAQIRWTFTSLAGNLLIVPLNYFMFFDLNVLEGPNTAVIPTAWSLGAEIQAYISYCRS